MHVEQIEAKSKGQVVGTGEIDVYDSVDEAVNALGATKCLSFINRQNKIQALDRIRASVLGTGGKQRIPKALKDKLLAISDEDLKAKIKSELGIDIDELG